MRIAVVLSGIVATALLAASSAGAVAPSESVLLSPLHGSHVGGRIVYRAAGNGTRVASHLRGLPAGADLRVLLHAGSCRKHGASFAVVIGGRLEFHGTPVPISSVTDGHHVFTVVVDGREEACAAIPGIS